LANPFTYLELHSTDANRVNTFYAELFETALVIAVIALFLEVIHYRNAVLEANVDRSRAWKTVVELRKKCESVEPKPDGK